MSAPTPRPTTPPHPPRLAARLIESLAVDNDQDHLLGDLHEAFSDRAEREGPAKARRWYWRQAGHLALGFTRVRLGWALSPGAANLDLRRALRSLRRTPVVAGAGILTLGLGIGAPTTIFGIVDTMFSRLPVPSPEQVVSIQVLDPTTGHSLGATPPVLDAWRTSVDALESVGGYRSEGTAVSSEGVTPVRTNVAEMTHDVFSVLGAQALEGRVFSLDDTRSGAPPVALIREDLAVELFGRAGAALGEDVRVGGRYFTIVGVMPRGFGFPVAHKVWTAMRPQLEPARSFRVVARLQPDATPQRAMSQLDASLRGLALGGGEELTQARTIIDEYVLGYHGRSTRSLLWGLNLIVGFLLVIAAANVSALFLARGSLRSGETALRRAVGAGRVAVMRPLVLEALIVSAGGALVGIGIADVATSWFGGVLENRGVVPYWATFGVRGPVFLFAAVLMGGSTLVAGVLPALRTSRPDLAGAMKATPGSARSGTGILPVLVGVEVTLACTLLLLSAFVVRGALGTVQRLGSFPMDGVLTASLSLEPFDYPTDESRSLFYTSLERALAQDADVSGFTLATAMPGDGTSRAAITVEGVTYEREQDRPAIQRRVVDPRFFSMFGMKTRAGRTFADTDTPNAPPVAVVNESYARLFLPDGPTVGQRIRVTESDGTSAIHEIVGLVSDPGVSVDDGRRVPAVFLPVAQRHPSEVRLAVRTRAGAAALEVMASNIGAIDPALPLDRVMTLEALVRRENDGGRVFGILFGSLGLAALLLSVVGLHGVVSFTTAQRTREIGIMRALGAPGSEVLLRTVTNGLRPVLIGLCLGLVFSWLLTPLLGEELLTGEPGRAHDPLMFALVPMVLLLGAVAATYLPAARASRVDPVTALRSE